MTAAARSGPASALPAPRGKARTVEPFLLECVVEDIQVLRSRFRRLLSEASAEAARQPTPAWRQLRDEVAAAHQRAERMLLAAAARDRIRLIDEAGATEPPALDPREQPVSRFRRWAREIEGQCACLVGQAHALGLHQVAEVLARWRRDLIGLEQPLIAANAASNGRKR